MHRVNIKSKNSLVTYNKVVTKLALSKISTAHSLIELSDRQWLRLESKSVLLTKMQTYTSDNNRVEYNQYKLGSDLCFKRMKGISSCVDMQWRSPMLANIKGNYMLIVGSKREIISYNPDIIIIDSSNQELLFDNVNDNSDYQPSGIVVLCMVKLERQKIHSQYLWGNDDAINIKKCKTNIITGHSTHYGSSGNYYSFGNRANYGLIGKSSLTQFVHKKVKSNSTTNRLEMEASRFENLLAEDLKYGVKSLISIIPNVQEYISPTLNIAYNLQDTVGDCNLKKTAVSEIGLWQSSICINCQTSSLHTENDCTYTVITTPNQGQKTVPIFLFEVQKGFTIGLQMDPGLTFMFSGKYLYHRQMLLDGKDENTTSYINLASYGNAKLFNHFKSTIGRVHN